MGFSIGRFLGAIAPIVGGLVAGPAGAAIGGAVSVGIAGSSPSAAAATGRATQPGPISNQVAAIDPQFAGGFQPSSIAPTMASLARLPAVVRDVGVGLGLGSLPSLFGGGNGQRSPISTILAKARAATGGPVTRNKIIDAAKTCGLEIAANTFGLEVREVCLVVVKGRTRRRRGVSAADIRRTKRTIHFASKVRKDLKALAR
jgi:hypothetical protein